MNRTIRNLIVAAPLATIALTVVPMGAATAGPNGPDVIVIKPKGGDPLPGPGDIKDAPKPKGPKDKAPLPKPKKPGDKAPKPAAKAPKAAAPVAAADAVVETVAVVTATSNHVSPDSIDRNLFVAGPAETELVADQDTDGGLDLTWLLIGGGIVTASGIAVAARKRQQNA